MSGSVDFSSIAFVPPAKTPLRSVPVEVTFILGAKSHWLGRWTSASLLGSLEVFKYYNFL